MPPGLREAMPDGRRLHCLDVGLHAVQPGLQPGHAENGPDLLSASFAAGAGSGDGF